MFLVDYRINKDVEEYFKKKNWDYIKTIENKDLYEEISGHPDIVACKIGNVTVLEMKTYNFLAEKIKDQNIVRGKATLRSKYPFDIAYNVIVTDKYLIGNLKFVDDIIIKIARSQNLELINVKQGYARCSTIVVKNDIFITSDIGIYRELIKNDIHIYYVKADDIVLSQRYSGFLGGACFYFNDELIFFGNISENHFYKRIKTILEANNINYVNLFEGKLTDYGSAIELI
ncbi:hypothetical protein HMPREF1142_1351 [Peptostreptococcaceae bacterium AS15]|nr:hypothetical protein HMPREF1142_1351 [Peptostreptococcaceae bacterium AS15]